MKNYPDTEKKIGECFAALESSVLPTKDEMLSHCQNVKEEQTMRPIRTQKSFRKALVLAACLALIGCSIIAVAAVSMHRTEKPLPPVSTSGDVAHQPSELPPLGEDSSVSGNSGTTTSPAEPSSEPVDPGKVYEIPRVEVKDELPFEVPLYYSCNVAQAYTPEAEGQDAISWLLQDNGTTYHKFSFMNNRYCPIDEPPYFDTTPFMVWSEGMPQADFFYAFDFNAAEVGLHGEEFAQQVEEGNRFIYELWYKRADSSDPYQGIRTTPTSNVRPYIYGDQLNDAGELEYSVVFVRVPTYNEGMRDLATDNGKSVDYDLVIVIRDTQADPDSDIVGWGNLTLTIDTQYEKHLQEAFDKGLLELPQ